MNQIFAGLCLLWVVGCNSSDDPANPPQGIVPADPRDEILAENITAWGREHVGTGDDTLIDWHILSSRHEGDLSYVEVKPTPQEVGYDKFVFVISFADEPAGLIATYCFENGEYLMFSTTADLADELPDTLSW